MCGRPPLGKVILTALWRSGQVHSCVRPVARGTGPLAMMVSVDWVLIKLPRYEAH
jgi:hypothetical protein